MSQVLRPNLWRWIIINNNEVNYIKARVDAKLYNVLKKILEKLNMTQQELIEDIIKEFVIKNVHLVVPDDNNKSK